MSNEVEVARSKQYSANVFHLSQQKGSRLQNAVRREMQRGVSAFYDRIGSVDAQTKVGRHSDTQYSDTPHSRRMVTLVDKFYADLVDNEDKVRMLISPESEYAKAAVYALGRAKDDEIIKAALGPAFGGEQGTEVVNLPDSQKVAASNGTATAGTNLNVRTLRFIKEKFDSNDVDEELPKHIAITSLQLQSLLGEEEITSADFAIVKALVQGDVNFYMGFNFIRTQRLPRAASNVTFTPSSHLVGAGGGTIVAATSRRCFAWAQDGLLLATARDINARITEMPNKHYATQVYASLHMGATRMEEEKVVEVICSEA